MNFKYFSHLATCEVFAGQYLPDGHLPQYRDIGGRHLNGLAGERQTPLELAWTYMHFLSPVEASERARCPDGHTKARNSTMSGDPPTGGRPPIGRDRSRAGEPRSAQPGRSGLNAACQRSAVAEFESFEVG